jgi:hypothetical protein
MHIKSKDLEVKMSKEELKIIIGAFIFVALLLFLFFLFYPQSLELVFGSFDNHKKLLGGVAPINAYHNYNKKLQNLSLSTPSS